MKKSLVFPVTFLITLLVVILMISHPLLPEVVQRQDESERSDLGKMTCLIHGTNRKQSQFYTVYITEISDYIYENTVKIPEDGMCHFVSVSGYTWVPDELGIYFRLALEGE